MSDLSKIIFGRLTWESFPIHEPILVGTFAVVALLILGGTVLHRWLGEYEAVMGWVILGLIGLAVAGYVWRVATWKPRHMRGPASD